jgi:hypothetical protein
MKTLNTILTVAIITLSVNCFAGNNNKMTGTYTIGKSAASNFKTVSAALTAVQHNGANGPVTFIVDKNVYNQKLIIAALAKTAANNNIAFISSDDQNNIADISDDATASIAK